MVVGIQVMWKLRHGRQLKGLWSKCLCISGKTADNFVPIQAVSMAKGIKRGMKRSSIVVVFYRIDNLRLF